jgi:phospholipase D1/2
MTIFVPNANVWRLERADRFSVLLDGAAFFGAVRQAAIEAQHSIVITGWDLDSRTRLVGESGEPDDSYPVQLSAFLGALVEERPALNVYLLLWDYSLLYAVEREPFPLLALQWKTPPRVHFSLDNCVPLGASQHQKIIVVDDCVAFSGGLDLTGRRWDTPKHDIDNPWRIDAAGEPYRPFHDVQAIVDGDAARALSELARERWRCVTAQELPRAEPQGDRWPAHLQPDFRDVSVGIARTQPAMEAIEETREVEQLFLDSIDTAQRSLYIENQFFTSSVIAKRIAERMQARPQLETLLIGPQNHESWVEARTMRNGRIRFMRTLADAGVGDRVRLVYPHVENSKASTDTMLHSKVMIIDDRFLRIGSANLNNRSMGTDSECDLAIEAGSPEERAKIADIRHRLLADHCGVSAGDVARVFAEGKNLIEASQMLSGDGHSLWPVDDGEPDPEEMARYVEGIADPERPIAAQAFVSMQLSGQAPRLTMGQTGKLAAALIFVIGLTAAWHFTPLSDLMQPTALEETMTAFAASPWAPLYVMAAYLAGGLVAFPVIVLIAATAAVFGPVLGFAYGLLGSIASAVLTYGVGAWLGRRPLQSFFGPRLNLIRDGISRSGILAIAAVRLVPIAPFTIVNMVAGACQIRMADYVVGTALGLLPGLLLMSTVGHQIFRFIVAPSASGLLILAGAAVVWVVIVVAAQRLAVKAGSGRH